jgi:hypothetical protein
MLADVPNYYVVHYLCADLQVTVHYPQGRQQLVVYRQAFTGPTRRHCCSCFRPVEGCGLPQDAVLQGALDLFCSLDCERLFFIKNSSSECMAERHAAGLLCYVTRASRHMPAMMQPLAWAVTEPPAALQRRCLRWLTAMLCELLLPLSTFHAAGVSLRRTSSDVL